MISVTILSSNLNTNSIHSQLELALFKGSASASKLLSILCEKIDLLVLSICAFKKAQIQKQLQRKIQFKFILILKVQA